MKSRDMKTPWCWAEKAALRTIRGALDRSNNVASALAVYLALCEIASDEGSPEFTTTHAWLSNLSGASRATVQRRLSDLAGMGLVHIETPELRAPSTFRLLAALPHNEAALPQELKTLRGRSKEPKEKKESTLSQGNAFIIPSLEEVQVYAGEIGLPEIEAEKFHNHFVSNGWRVGGRAPMKDWQAALRNWKNRMRTPAPRKPTKPDNGSPDYTKGF